MIPLRFRLTFAAAYTGTLHLYAVDWDSTARRQTVEVLDASTGAVLNSHRSASQPFHKLEFLADLGLNIQDVPVRKIVHKVKKHQSTQGPFQLPTNVPVHFGGSGKDEWAWALCDAPVILASLVQMGMGGDPRLQSAVKYLNGLVRDNGWPCAVSPELGKFRGPGRKEDPCPYATLVMVWGIARYMRSVTGDWKVYIQNSRLTRKVGGSFSLSLPLISCGHIILYIVGQAKQVI